MDITTPKSIPKETISYANFRGIDRSRAINALESREKQPLWDCRNAVCDWRSAIKREYPVRALTGSSSRNIVSTKFFTREGIAFAEEEQGGVSLNSDRGHRVPLAYDEGAIVTMTVYRGGLHAMSPTSRIYVYDGYSWQINGSDETPAFGVPLQERLFIHDPKKPTEVLASRVKNANVFPSNEDPDSIEVTKASFIDIQNLIGTADAITGLGAFEANRLAIFTNDQALIYKVDPDFNQWQLDNRANIRVGCISHRTIINVGSDIIFCSRHGVHSIMRSDANGVTINELSLANQIEDLYKSLVAKVKNKEEISACYDQDEGELHIFFPLDGGQSERLTLSLRGGYENARWTTGDTLNARCGDFLAGRLAIGTNGGLFEYIKNDLRALANTDGQQFRGKFSVTFPILYHGDIRNQKDVSTILIHASGDARLILSAYDEIGTELTSETFTVSSPEDGSAGFPYNPLDNTFEIFFQFRYRGVQLKIESEDGDNGDVRIYSIAFDVNKPPKGK